MIGKTISHYKIIDKIGAGGMGTVYKAQDTKLDRFVALKFLPPHLSQAEQEKKRFIHEAKAASALQHNNICTIYEINETDDGQIFIAMEYIDGVTLKEVIAEDGSKGEAFSEKISKVRKHHQKHASPQHASPQPLTIPNIIDITTQIAKGLEKAHAKKIVHRDIKPANILVTEDGVVKIVDFGLAKLAGGTKLTKTGSTLGTVAYMSPEQAQSKPVDQRTDIWSLGVILYEMLTGCHPFEGEYEQAVIYSILNEAPDPIGDWRPDAPESLVQVVTKALEKNPEKRYQTVTELLEDLNAISSGIVPEAIKARMRKAKLLKRKWAMIYSFGILAVIAGIIAVSVLFKRARTIDSIAVLPLKNLTGDTGQDYFTDGMTDELIGELGQISGLKRVISRTSAMQYKDTDKSLSEIARELKVDAMVEGTVYQVGDSIRVRFQLIDVLPEEQNLWGKTYVSSMGDVFMMYSDVARTVAHEIRIGLTRREETHFTTALQINPQAYEAYLKGMSHLYKLTPPELETALHYFERALEIDSNYALAYTGISFVWIGRQQMGLLIPSEATPKAKAAAQKALELDDTLAEVHYTLAIIKTWSDWDWEGAEQAFKRALELKPNYAEALVYYSNLLCYMDRLDEALAMSGRAMQLDPLNSIVLTISGSVLEYLHRYDEIIELAQKALRTSPNDPVGHNTLWTCYYMMGMFDESLNSAKAFFNGLGMAPIAEAMTRGYAIDGYSGAMKSAAEIMVAYSKQTYISPYFIGQIYAFSGDKENSIEWLERGYEMKDPMMPYVSAYTFDLLRDDTRYQELLRKMNLPFIKE